jgi:predicted short-subunit dehydrogenase-like oxidoreductase (DUF2520 family)
MSARRRPRGPMRVVIMGRGKVGRGLFRALRATRTHARLAPGRALKVPDVSGVDLLVLAVPDDAISACAHRMAPHVAPGAAVVHCSGARGLDVLDACRARGVAVAAMHPMASFADARRPPDLRGTSLVVQGDAKAARAVRRMAKEMDARVVTAAVHGPAYHAAAALAANAGAALAAAAVDVLQRVGMGRRESLGAVAGLLRTVAHNVERVGVPEALTGPVARGDAATVRAHREGLASVHRRALATYDRVAPVILETAVAAGLPPARARAIRRAISAALPPRG